ncbi:MAG: DUF4402 domain-containing protein [Sphingomonadaceae bacterium]
MNRRLTIALAALALLEASSAMAQCRLCAPAPVRPVEAPQRPLTIEIEAGLDFSRAAQTGRGGGTIRIDERSGVRTVVGLDDLGGIGLKGTARLSGEPLARVGVVFPASIRLTAPDGSIAEITDLRTDLPPDPQLDPAGGLRFFFGGRLVVTSGQAGDFRGRIPVTVEYR